jgi:hypothetical protein
MICRHAGMNDSSLFMLALLHRLSCMHRQRVVAVASVTACSPKEVCSNRAAAQQLGAAGTCRRLAVVCGMYVSTMVHRFSAASYSKSSIVQQWQRGLTEWSAGNCNVHFCKLLDARASGHLPVHLFIRSSKNNLAIHSAQCYCLLTP